MSDFAKDALLLVIGAAATGAIGGIGFLLKRRMTRTREDPVESFVAHHERLLAAHANATSRPDPQDLHKLQDTIRELHPGVGFQNLLNIEEPDLSNAEIQLRAAQDADAALLSVRQLVERLEYPLNDEQKAALRESQDAWDRHAGLQARLAAAAFEGGTIMPTIYHAERAALARERALALKRVLDAFGL